MLTKNLTRYGAILFAAVCALALLLPPLAGVPKARSAGLPTDEFKAKTPGIPDSTIQTISDFDLNKAKVVGGSAKVADPVAPGATAVTSPDGNFKLIQGTRMFVEYVNKAAITDFNGNYQTLPGSITLQWDDAAVDKTTGKKLDVQLTLNNVNVKSLKSTKDSFNKSRLALIVHWNDDNSHSFAADLNAPGATSPEQAYKNTGFSSLCTFSWGNLSTFANYTVKFLNKDGSENTGSYNMLFTDIDQEGTTGRPGSLKYGYTRADKSQEHVKLLTSGDSLYVTNDTALWTNSGYPKREAWATKEADGLDTRAWALAHIRSGSTFEMGTPYSCGSSLFAQLEPLFSKITVTKKGNEQSAGVTLPTGTNVSFTYEVKNIGLARVDKIAVTDSRGVKVTCPKATLNPGESMVCTGNGPVK